MEVALQYVLAIGSFVFSFIAGFVGVLALIFKRTRLYKTKKIEELNKLLAAAEKKYNSTQTAWEKGDEGLKLVLEPMVEEAKANVEALKKEIEKVQTKK